MNKMTNGEVVIWVSDDDVYDAKKDGFWLINTRQTYNYGRRYRRW